MFEICDTQGIKIIKKDLLLDLLLSNLISREDKNNMKKIGICTLNQLVKYGACMELIIVKILHSILELKTVRTSKRLVWTLKLSVRLLRIT